MLPSTNCIWGYENLWLFAKLYDVPRSERESRIREVLALMDLQQAADKLVNTYSGGMIRRLEIGQALLHRPSVLFLLVPARSIKSERPANTLQPA